MRILLALIIALPAFAQDASTQAAAQPPADKKAESPAPAPATEDWLTGSIDLGFRWVPGVGGSVAAYRSVVDLQQGPELFGIDFTIRDPHKRLFDHLNARGYGWGGEPYNTAHVDASKSGIYDFTFDYRNIAYFNALPSYANPLAPGGFNQQSFDTRRRTLSTELDFFPGKRIIPYLAFEQNSGNGHGIDTWVTDPNNQYAVPALFRDGTKNYRGGVRFEYTRFHVTLEQGGTTFKNDEQTTNNFLNWGNRTTPVLGQTLYLTNLQQSYGIRGDAIYERGLVTATPVSWLTVTGQFLYSQPETSVHYTDSAAGNFLLLSTLLAYNGQTDVASGYAKQPHVTGNVAVEVRPLRRLRILESFMTDRFHDAAMGVVATTLASGPSLIPMNTSQPGYQVVNYNQDEVNAIYDLTAKITLRGGYRRVWGDATVLAGQLSQSGTFASGQLSRNVALAGASLRPMEKLRISLDYEGASSDTVYFHTSLNDYQKAHARAQYQVNPSLALTANFRFLSNQNPATTVQYDFQSRDSSLALSWTPNNSKRFSVVGEYDRATMRSNINYLSLPFLSPAVSQYRDNAHVASSTFNMAFPAYKGLTPTLTFGGSLFISSGSRPTHYYQPLGRFFVPVSKHVAWVSEWRWYGLGETFYVYEGFRSHTITTGLRLTR